MTIPIERTRAVLNTRQFLRDLADPKVTPRVPRAQRRQALALLKHFPMAFDFEPRRLRRAFGDPAEKF